MTGEHNIHQVHALTHVDIAMALGAFFRAVYQKTLPPDLLELFELTNDVIEADPAGLEGEEAIKAMADLQARAVIHYMKEA